MLFFVNFLNLKVGDDPSHQESKASWLLVSHSMPELAIPRKPNHIFERISLSNATSFFMVFFACGIQKLNHIH